jgi:hypothetical protein
MKKIVVYLLIATFIAGVLDIALAFINSYFSNGVTPGIVLRYIASAIYGPRAFSQEGSFEMLGLAFHFFITFVFAVLYFYWLGNIRIVRRNWLLSGIIYGTLICIVMNFMVLPLTKISSGPIQLIPLLKSIGMQIIGTGIPITYFFDRYLKTAPRSGTGA